MNGEDLLPLSSDVGGRLVSPEQEGRAFWRMRARMASTVVAQTISAGRLRLATIVLLSGILWSALFLIFFEGFAFLHLAIAAPDIYDQTVHKVFSTFFLALMFMLFFSSAVILYSSLFRGQDIAFLFTLPARAERVFLNKFQEAILMSSWAFVLLGSPMLLAYGLNARAPWWYYAMLLPFLFAFTYIPAGLGSLACLTVVHRLPERRWHLLILIVVGIVLLVLGVRTLRLITAAADANLLTPTWFQDMLGRLSMTEMRLLPSWWLSVGLLYAAQGGSANTSDSVMFLGLTIANALFVRQLAVWTAAAVYRPAYSLIHSRNTPRRRVGMFWMDRWALALARPFSPQIRLLILKDLRLFRRDPMQWLQVLIFIGLLVVYFLNIHGFAYDVQYAPWVSVVSLLNLTVVGLLLSTFTTRFIFPLISMEGRRFWVLGLLPLGRDTLLWSKFVFAVGASLVPASLLVLLSDVMLRLDPRLAASHQLTCAILCFGLSGIAVGLGAKMPNLREDSPARISAGFGGTLNLVLSTLYILVVVALTAVPFHAYYGSGFLPRVSWLTRWLDTWLWLGTAGSLLLGLAITAIPMASGLRALRKAEF